MTDLYLNMGRHPSQLMKKNGNFGRDANDDVIFARKKPKSRTVHFPMFADVGNHPPMLLELIKAFTFTRLCAVNFNEFYEFIQFH